MYAELLFIMNNRFGYPKLLIMIVDVTGHWAWELRCIRLMHILMREVNVTIRRYALAQSSSLRL